MIMYVIHWQHSRNLLPTLKNSPTGKIQTFLSLRIKHFIFLTREVCILYINYMKTLSSGNKDSLLTVDHG